MNPETSQLPVFTLLTLILLLQKSLSDVNQNYLACKPFQCGSLNISYPFFIADKQPQFCGSEGFNVSCNPQNQTIIYLSSDEYIINSISYQELSINTVNSAFSSSEFSCLSSVHNLTLDLQSKFSFPRSYEQEELILLEHCSSNLASIKKYSAIKCKEDTIFAINSMDFKQEEVGKCSETVIVQYDAGETEDDGIQGLLRKGIILEFSANNCSECQRSGGRCGFHNNTSDFYCFCPEGDHIGIRLCHGSQGKHLAIILITVCSGSVVIIIVVLSLYYRRRRKINGSSTNPSTTKIISDNKKIEAALRNHTSLAPKRYTYSNIKKMTNSFAEKLGEGGFGSVYKGKLLDGRLVAVKLLKNSKADGEGFINEVVTIGRTNHVNVVTLLGFCFDGRKRALVYEYMVNGSLEKFRHGGCVDGEPLTIETMFKIVLGIARGLEYLHRGCTTRILHFDIKPHNILLDAEYCPKISDFGLAKMAPQNKQSKVSMSGMRGTVGYIAPEVFCKTFGEVSHKSDVYSYGMMVLETIGSRRKESTQVLTSSDLYFPQYIYKELENEELQVEINMTGIDEENKQVKRKMIAVSLWCIQPVPSSRPSMSRVVQMLEESIESIEIPPMPTLSSPPRLEWDPSTSSTTTT